MRKVFAALYTMEPAPGPPMMTRVGGQTQPGNYDSILRATEQDQHQAANPVYQPAPVQPRHAEGPPQAYYGQQPQQHSQQHFQQVPTFQDQQCQYNPNVAMSNDQQPSNFAAGMGPWAGMPNAQAAFESGPPLYSGPQGPGEEMQAQSQAQPQPQWQAPSGRPASVPNANKWVKYRDWITVSLVVFLLLKYAMPEAAKRMPSLLGNPTSLQSTTAVALFAGCICHAGNKSLKTWR